jgi:hypothetical protein
MSGSKVTWLKSPKNKVNGKQIWVGIYVIKRISHGLQPMIGFLSSLCVFYPLAKA